MESYVKLVGMAVRPSGDANHTFNCGYHRALKEAEVATRDLIGAKCWPQGFAPIAIESSRGTQHLIGENFTVEWRETGSREAADRVRSHFSNFQCPYQKDGNLTPDAVELSLCHGDRNPVANLGTFSNLRHAIAAAAGFIATPKSMVWPLSTHLLVSLPDGARFWIGDEIALQSGGRLLAQKKGSLEILELGIFGNEVAAGVAAGKLTAACPDLDVSYRVQMADGTVETWVWGMAESCWWRTYGFPGGPKPGMIKRGFPL